MQARPGQKTARISCPHTPCWLVEQAFLSPPVIAGTLPGRSAVCRGGWGVNCSLFTRRAPRKTCMPTMFICIHPSATIQSGSCKRATIKPRQQMLQHQCWHALHRTAPPACTLATCNNTLAAHVYTVYNIPHTTPMSCCRYPTPCTSR